MRSRAGSSGGESPGPSVTIWRWTCWSRLSTRCDIDRLVSHSDRGVQYLSIKYTQRLAKAGIGSSVGSVGNAYDNALAETIIGLYKTEVIEKLRPSPNAMAVELETLGWVTSSTTGVFLS